MFIKSLPTSFHCSKSVISPVYYTQPYCSESSQTNTETKLFPWPKWPRAIAHNLKPICLHWQGRDRILPSQSIHTLVSLPVKFIFQLTPINHCSWTHIEGKDQNSPFPLQVLVLQALRVCHISQSWAWASLRRQLSSPGNVHSRVGVLSTGPGWSLGATWYKENWRTMIETLHAQSRIACHSLAENHRNVHSGYPWECKGKNWDFAKVAGMPNLASCLWNHCH